MKIDHQKLIAAYIAKVNQICDDCEDKTYFSIPEIVSIIATLLDSGEYYISPPNSSAERNFALDNRPTKD